MNRNMLRRVELAWPMTDPALRQRIIDECLVAYLHDGRDAWDLSSPMAATSARGHHTRPGQRHAGCADGTLRRMRRKGEIMDLICGVTPRPKTPTRARRHGARADTAR
jgi:polyphosphate kinase